MSTEKDTEATTAATTAAAEETEAPVAAEASSEAAEAAAAAESASGEDGEDQELASIREQMAAWDAVAGKLEAEVGTDAKSAAASASDSDARSIFVSNVDYSTTDAELTEFFASCGAVSRVKILKDKFTGQPKGFAYVEFKDPDAVVNAHILNETEFKGRPLKIMAKRSNVPYSQLRGGRGGPRGAGTPRGARGGRGGPVMRGGMMYMPVYMPMPMYGGRGRGRGAPRGGGRGRGAPAPH